MHVVLPPISFPKKLVMLRKRRTTSGGIRERPFPTTDNHVQIKLTEPYLLSFGHPSRPRDFQHSRFSPHKAQCLRHELPKMPKFYLSQFFPLQSEFRSHKTDYIVAYVSDLTNSPNDSL